MDDALLQLGVGGIFALMIIKEVFNFLSKRNGGSKANLDDSTISRKVSKDLSPKVDESLHILRDLHEWHSKTDEDGVKVWYVRRSLERTIDDLSDAIKAQNELLQEQTRALRDVLGKLEVSVHDG